MYQIAKDLRVPTYALMCQLLPFVPPAHWVFFTDEKIPYEVKTLPAWKPEDISSFVRSHKHDWKETGRKYGISDSLASNIFVSHRTRPTFQLIQNARNEVNPEEFFTVGDVNDDGRFYPERGDIIAIQGRTVLVLSTKQRNREMSSMTALDIKDGEVDYNTLCTIRYVRSMPELVEKAEALVIEKALKEVGRILE